MGCSIGGRVVLHLALRHPGAFRALIGLKALGPCRSVLRYDLAASPRRAWRRGRGRRGVRADRAASRPRPSAGKRCGTTCRAAPACSRETFIFTASTATSAANCPNRHGLCPLYLLTGEYDYSCTPGGHAGGGRAVPGAKVTIMKELGPLPDEREPCSVPVYLEPVLAEIAGRE